jgi:hypothetical protein
MKKFYIKDYAELLEPFLLDEENKNRQIFFLFEENSFWYASAHEILKQKSKNDKFILIIFGNSMPRILDGTKNFVRKNQGGFFRHYNWLKYSLRRMIPSILPSRKPSKVLIESLADEDIIVIDLSNSKVNLSRGRTLNQAAKIKWQEITMMCLGEIYSTEYIQHYLPDKIVDKYITSAIIMEEEIARILSRIQPLVVHYLNGRTLYERITLEICQELGIKSIAYETSSSLDRYQSYEGSVANLKPLTESMQNLWTEYCDDLGEQAAIEIGKKFFEDRIRDPRSNSFLLQMNEDSNISKEENELTYTFFTSSSEEMYAIYSLFNIDPPDQERLILNLIELFESDLSERRKLVIRVHPNLRSKRDKDREFYDSLKDSKNVKIFAYNSGINSYQLAACSDFVLTTVSTIGLEAAFLRVPTFCFGKTFWSGLELTTCLNSVLELFDAVPVNTEYAYQEAIKAGLFYQEYGEKYRFTNMKQLMDFSGNYIFDPLRWFLRRLHLNNLGIVQTSGLRTKK